MVSRLILNLRGADDAQKNHMRLSGMGSDHSAKRGTLGACGFSPLDGETLTLLFVFLCLVPGPNQRHRYSCVPHSCVGDLYFVLQFLAHNHDSAYSDAILFLGLVLGHWGHCNFRLYHAHV